MIWLNDLDRYLSGGGLTAGLIERLAKGNVVVATLRAREWDRFQPTDQLRPPEWDVLCAFEKVTLDRDRDRPSEEDLVGAVSEVEIRERISCVGIGEYVGAGQRIIDQLDLGAQSHPLGYALVRGAVDWWRTGVARPVPAGLLPVLADVHLNPRQRAALADDAGYADALAWATREINPTVALLEPGDGVFTVYDFALDQLSAINDEPSAVTWSLVIDNVEPAELAAIGYQAEVTYGRHDVAQRAWRRAADGGNSDGMRNLGVMLCQAGDLAEAEIWLRRAAETGDSLGMGYLGVLLYKRGDLIEAESWFRRAIDTGSNSVAMNNLGVLVERHGNLAEAETWYRQAIDAGYTGAMCNLGGLLRRQGELAEAEAWFRHAAETGDSDGMGYLGALLYQRGSLIEAENWYRHAAEAGHAASMNNLGSLLSQRRDITEAETWYRQAIDAGYTGAMYNLGVLLQERGDITEAEAWYRRASGTGHSAAMYNLGVLSAEQGKLPDAEN